ncbi:Imidazolonepropionase [hydrothermal vent metagenome]|uniref:imidazolonepropionase n=1 Tax=hydrothermal vent metagenome TaxID=652676 RepID=A0A3B0SWB4_9ZZZZ
MKVRSCDLLLAGASEVVSSPPHVGPLRNEALDRLVVTPFASLAIESDRIVGIGPHEDIARQFTSSVTVDVSGKVVSAGLIDPHTHLVHGGARDAEYEAIVTGGSLAVSHLGGGINSTVAMTRSASDAELTFRALADLDTMLALGTTTIEAKSGYGLSRDQELRLLRVVANLDHPVSIERTYLGAHVVPTQTDRRIFVDQIIATLPEARLLADWCDVFCDPVGFTVPETRAIGVAALMLGFRMRLHADQTGDIAGAALAAELGAGSADHLDYISDAGIAALAASDTVGVVLPSVALHMLEIFPGLLDGRTIEPSKPDLAERVHAMLDAGVALALSTDYNPGSSPCLSMQLVMQLAMRFFHLSYAQVWNMATANAAHSLGLGHDRGTIAPGMRADLVVWNVPTHGLVINRFGASHVAHVVKDGRMVYSATSA